MLTRNERIGNEHLDPALVYECPKVESPREIWALNSWPLPGKDPLKYQLQVGQTLRDALNVFFKALLNGAPLDSLAFEVSAALHCQRESLSVDTAYSIVPIDMMPASSELIAQRVFNKCQVLLGGLGGDNVTAPPEMDVSALRLHIKIGLKGDAVKRTLLEIASIDFPLMPPKLNRASSPRLTKSRSRGSIRVRTKKNK